MEDQELTLFSVASSDSPLPQKQRPKRITDIVGQRHVLNSRFHSLLKSDRWSGFIFWGPPGTGKTSLAWAIAAETGRPFYTLSAVSSGVKEIRERLDASFTDFKNGRPSHILFIDELHRLNKAQQDVLLPFLEQGSIRFIGATTENPSFEVNSAVASRCLIFHFNALSTADLESIISQAMNRSHTIDPTIVSRIAEVSNGDARRALNILENLTLACGERKEITLEDFEKLSHAQSLYYDKKSESHYDTISAFIKSVRGSDPNAAVYYLARMLEGGEDPLFIARRLIILASEDIGNAEPSGLAMAVAGFQAVHAIGMPEARIILSQVATFLACAHKSNRSYVAINQAIDVVKKTGSLSIPMHLRNGVTHLMKEWGYGKGYDYPHNHPSGWTKAQYLPDELESVDFYQPTDRGREAEFSKWLRLTKALPNKEA
ncbi:MAG: replication-associated recombination protein A [Deltaproteobacteria bacterium]|nr:replication-associated recombination protein A [Deltaproteobacteria bacterium]MBI3293676.1 replication-associated recombination protein A [Deltaproteobacteria bacterium]